MLENLSPQQKQLLMFGAPVVAVFALVTVISGKKQSSADTTTTPQVVGAGAGVDAGSFGEFLNSVNAQVVGGFDRLQSELDATEAQLRAENASQLASNADSLTALTTRVGTLADSISRIPATTTVINNTPPPSVAPPPVAPGGAIIVANPIQGDNSTVVAGVTAEGHPYVYGGTTQQGDLLVKQSAGGTKSKTTVAKTSVAKLKVLGK